MPEIFLRRATVLQLKSYILLTAVLSLMFAPVTRADDRREAETARRGVVRCGGNNFLRLSGNELQLAAYTLRNYDSKIPITIDRMIFYYADGAVLFDTSVNGFPAADNGILGPTNNVLGPNQTALFLSDDFLPFLDPTDRPIQLEIQWSSPRPAITLDAVLLRQARGAGTSAALQRGMAFRECRNIRLN